MSQRAKRPNRSEDGPVPVKRRKRTAAEEEEAAASQAAVAAAAGAGPPWPRPTELKGIYNRATAEAPAELFRKDLISAMKLPDSEPLAADEYWVINDQWKQEWERGVQVPVNPDSLPEPLVGVRKAGRVRPRHDFRLPKNKYIRITKDDRFQPELHVLSHAPAKSEAACSYDLDESDAAWLCILNAERASAGLGRVGEDQLERAIERLESGCWERIQQILRDEEGVGIEYDENVICDVCRSPDSEEGNEMVFCDSCNICVHQACYGITRIPDGQWLCCTCNLGKRPECVLCPNKGGAMKCLRTGKKWAHVSCALWIPEVSIGCVEKMEPITKVSSIPQSRWALICVLCRERVGACIQCSVKTCKTAYHVTCAFKHGLEMRAIIEDENADDGVKLRSYCEKHSKSGKKEKSSCSGSENDDDSRRKKRKEMTSEEKNQARAVRLQEIEAEFFKHVTIEDVSAHSNLDVDALRYIYNYWKLKRKAGFNKPLLPPKSEDVDVLSQKREQADLEKMKMFVQLRQDLERVRNLCYMVSRREKLSRSFFRMREQTFHKQAAVLESSNSLQSTVVEAVIEANHGPSIYDRLYSHNGAEDHADNFDTILARIAGVKSPTHSGDDSKSEMNGLFKDVKNNPYKKIYYNGSSKRRSTSIYGSSMSSASSEDEKPKDNKENRLHSSSEEEKPPLSSVTKKPTPAPHKTNNISKVLEKKKKKKRTRVESSSEEEVKPGKKDLGRYSKSRLSQIEKELGETGSESDDLMPIRSSPNKGDNHSKNIKSMSSIYSDSDSSDESTKDDGKSSNSTKDERKPRTKAAVKDFSHKPSAKGGSSKESPETKKKMKNEEVKAENAFKKNDYVQSDLIVPQRQAAKKATENLKITTVSRAKDHVSPLAAEEPVKAEEREKPKQKSKCKPSKEMPKEEEKVKGKDVREGKETLKDKKKEIKASSDVDTEKETEKVELQEILAYVPQRQAAKKAAEHIKSGLGSKPAAAVTEPSPTDNDKPPPKKEVESKAKKEPVEVKRAETKKETEPAKAAKLPERKRKSSINSTSSSSSSSSSSSDSSGSSSSESDDDEEEEEPVKPPPPRTESLFSSPGRETAKRSAPDWPFLDKGPRPAATSGSSSSSDSSASSSPRKLSPSPPHPKADSASRAATPKPTVRNNNNKKQPSRARAGRGRARPSPDAGDRVGHADVGLGDLPDGRRVGVEGEQRGRARKGRQTPRNSLDDKVNKETVRPVEVPSPVGQTDKKLSQEPEIGKLEKEILERKADKEAGKKSRTLSTLDRLFGTPEKGREEQIEKASKSEKAGQIKKLDIVEEPKEIEKTQGAEKCTRDSFERHNRSEKPLIAPEKLIIPDKVPTEKAKPDVERLVETTEIPIAPSENIFNRKENYFEKVVVPEMPLRQDEALKVRSKSPYKDFKEHIEKKTEHKEDKKSTNKKVQSKSKSIDDILASKLLSSDTKENKIDPKKPPTPKQPSKPTDEITIADKIVEDHLQSHKANDFYNRQPDVQEIIHAQPDITKNFLNELDTDKKNNLKPTGFTVQVLQNRSIFSPQPHIKEATDFLDLVNFDDDMGMSKDDDDISKGPLTWNFSNTNMIREDTKEESARETLNLVEKLRMGLSKKSTVGEVSDATTGSEMENEKIDFMEQVVPVSSSEPSAKDCNIESQGTGHNDPQPKVQVQVANVEQSQPFEDTNKRSEQQPHPGFPYLNAENNSSVEPPPKNMPIPQLDTLTDHTAPMEGDERWVPPSATFPNIPTNYLSEPAQQALYLEAYVNAATQDHHKKLPPTAIPPQLDVRLHDDPLKSRSPSLPERIDRRISQTPLIDPASMDCMNSPMPYANIHPQAKWADCEIIPNRRSSSSSAASSTSSGSRRDDEEAVRMVNHASLDCAAYLPPPYPPDNFGGFPDGTSCYPVSLFPPPSLNTQLPFPPSGPAAMFPPAFGAPFPTPHSAPPIPKPVEEAMPPFSASCTAAFTSSEHNMALTAAMVNLPPTTSLGPPREDMLLAPPQEESLGPPAAVEKAEPAPVAPMTPTTANSTLPSPSTSLKSNSSTGKRSPSKPTRTSARVTSQMMNKSPAKSPGKSPRQETALKQSGPGRGKGDSKRGSGKSGFARGAANLRGRGRGRGRGKGSQHADYDFIGTIHNKLAGTVYDLDFEDDICNDNMADLKSMRERRKSVDVHERKFDSFGSARSTSRSPKFSSPSQTSHKNRNYSTDLRELRPPTPIEDSRSKTDVSLASSDTDNAQVFPDVTPPLPGPVDMRTYNSNFDHDQQTYNEQNLLSAFASGTTETQVQEIDEDFEKELQTVLSVKKPAETPSRDPSSNIKVSLSDSRNQLKVKIKGPIANYTSTVAPLPAATVDPIIVTNVSSAMNNAMSVGMSSGGPSSLRRMRKKELLRQYWTQDMNMDEPAGNAGYTAPTALPIRSTIITIPKAVASMTSIPTKEDYRDYRTDTDDLVESKHHRKESKARQALSRELRQLDLPADYDGHLEKRRSSLGGSNNASLSGVSEPNGANNKRRGRPPRPSQQQQLTPKLTIKIGDGTNSIVGQDEKGDRIRPPKKRLVSVLSKPSVEDLKRESMKFRKMIRKDLKTKKQKKRDKSEKKKKKKLESEIQIIPNQSDNQIKMTIRIGKKSDNDGERRSSGETTNHQRNDSDVKGVKRLAEVASEFAREEKTLKVTPIKLKLSRCHEGSGYMMKPAIANCEKETEERSVQPGQPPPEPGQPPPEVPVPPLPASIKDCEVR